MASDAIPIDELVKDVTFGILNHRDYDPNTDQSVRNALDAELQHMVMATQHAAFKKYDNFATQVGIHTYAVPNDFLQWLPYSLQYAATPFRTLSWITERSFIEQERERNQTSGDPTEFWYTHKDEDDGLWRFRVFPTPQSVIPINRVYLSMAKSIRLTVAGGDHILDRRFPTGHIEGLVAGALTHFPQYLDNATIAVKGGKRDEVIKDMANKSEPIAGNLLQKQAYGGGYRSANMPIVNIPNIRI